MDGVGFDSFDPRSLGLIGDGVANLSQWTNARSISYNMPDISSYDTSLSITITLYYCTREDGSLVIAIPQNRDVGCVLRSVINYADLCIFRCQRHK